MSERINIARTARDSVKGNKTLPQYSLLHLTTEALGESIRECQRTIDSMKQELTLCEDGLLHIRHKENRKYYFTCCMRGSHNEIPISDDRNRVYSLARRSFLVYSIQALDHRMKMLRRVADNAEEAHRDLQMKKKLAKFTNAGLDLSRILFTKEQNEWMDEPFTPNPYNRDSLTTQTSCGIWMRSKSEAIIGTSLETIGLPYRSDDLVRIISDGKNGMPFRDTYFADFKVPNFLGGITVHEHFGAFQMENYGDNALQRLNDYRDFKVMEIPGRPVDSNEFTWSFESDIRDAGGIKRLIRKLLLPM